MMNHFGGLYLNLNWRSMAFQNLVFESHQIANVFITLLVAASQAIRRVYGTLATQSFAAAATDANSLLV